jgi:hypothetical protein
VQFVTSALAFGALLFAVPLIIHLLNRQRFRKRDWAAMEYLLRAYRKQRRRLRTENLILLILRCLIPILLAFALARPIFTDGAGILPTAGTAHHIFVFDRSYSMGYQPSGSQSAHDKAMRMATRRLEQLEDKTGQKVTLVLAGIRPEFPVRGNPNMKLVRGRLARMGPPTDSAESLLPALGQIAEMLEEEKANPGETLTSDTRIYLFTDLQRNAFGEEFLKASTDDPKPPVDAKTESKKFLADSAREVLDRLKEHGSILVMDMGGAAGTKLDNLQITDLRLERAQAVAGVPLATSVKVRNLTASTQNVEVTLEKNNSEPSRKLVRVEAGAETEVHFQVVFRTTGFRQLKASIQTDGLQADNVVYRVVDVQKRLRILMVEGSIEDEYALMDSGWLRVILDPTRGTGNARVTEFETKVVDSTTFLLGQEKLQDYHMIVLANVERLSEKVADDIKAAVQAGTGLFVMCGERVQPESYNLHLFDNGEGPLPIRIEGFEGYDPGGDKYFRTQVIDIEQPVFSDFKESEPLLQVLQLAGVYRYFRTDRESLNKSGKILWQISNQQLSPLLIEGRFGEGRTLLLTSAITKQPKKWNTLDAAIHAMPFFHPLAHWLSHSATDPYNTTVGSSLTTIVRSRPRSLAVVLAERAGGNKVPVAQDGRPLLGGLFSLPAFTETAHAGIYLYEMELGETGSTEQVRLPFAVNPDPVEGDLEYVSHSIVREKLGIENISTALPEDFENTDSAGRSDLGPFLLYLVLFFILGEASWARFVSRRHSR